MCNLIWWHLKLNRVRFDSKNIQYLSKIPDYIIFSYNNYVNNHIPNNIIRNVGIHMYSIYLLITFFDRKRDPDTFNKLWTCRHRRAQTFIADAAYKIKQPIF